MARQQGAHPCRGLSRPPQNRRHLPRQNRGQSTCIHFLATQAEQTNNLLKKYATLRAAVRHAKENKILLRQLKVIHPPSIPGATPGYTENNLQKNLADTAQKIRVEIKVDGDENHRMGAVLEELVTRYGFVIGTPAILKISARIDFADTGQRTADLVFIRYALALQIKAADGTVLTSITEKGREAHISPTEARIRSFQTLEDTIRPTGTQRLDAYFDSLIDQAPK